MAGTRAAIRYAKAVLSLALSEKRAEAVDKDMKAIASTIAKSDELSSMLNNAVVKSDTKKTALLAIFPKLNSITTGLFDVLISNKRIDILNDVAVNYSTLFDAHNGKETAQVTTAVPLTAALESKVLAKVKELTNKKVELENIVDESIIGGFILRVGDKQYDASISNNLNKLKREFTLN
ncbi:ATP synthase F1 subunit delta [Hyunsoonleella sp. SJ7]|uniref:ATP synthase subunit delta n=1 Tax=Hyunsoonleella aquatilis TaxID=2762758 RepID=A0A923HBU5_9FLAO|nr:ATP synthase F1 subunit delta [Hyunsoonleella aquatilis]MBC3758459.1 ATP synthase F1 subunit delta [Hyunsoonleella aquatilis]